MVGQNYIFVAFLQSFEMITDAHGWKIQGEELMEVKKMDRMGGHSFFNLKVSSNL